MGTKIRGVRAASSSSIEIDFRYKGQRVKERIKLEPTDANLIKINKFRAAIIYAIETETFDYITSFPHGTNGHLFYNDPNSIRISTLLSQWLTRKKPQLKASTFQDYEKIVNNQLVQAFGEIRVVDFVGEHVTLWAETLNCSNKRIKNLISPLRDALNEARQKNIIDYNPLKDWSYRKNEVPKQSHVNPFTASEQQKIFAELNGQVKNFYQFAFWSGLRTSELIGLEWCDIDFSKNQILIRQAFTAAAERPESPKTKTSSRFVKILSPALDALICQKSFTYLKGGFVFNNPRTNNAWSGDKPLRENHWRPALKRAGVKYRNPYQTRHTYASMMLSAGEKIAWVSSQLGHADISVTTRRYTRWIPDTDPQAGLGAVKIFSH